MPERKDKKHNNKNNHNSKDYDYDEIGKEDNEKYEIDDDDILDEVNRISKKYKKTKLISVFELLGKPRKYPALKSSITKEDYDELLLLLEKKGITILFKFDYPLKEKYRFIVEEVFIQGVEENIKKHNINFIYEEFHPVINEDED